MDLKKFKQNLSDEFDIPNEFELVLFRNPNEFRYFNIERINPNHRIILWGRLKKRDLKYLHFVKVGKILVHSFIPLFALGILKTDVVVYNLMIVLLSLYFNKFVFNIMDRWGNSNGLNDLCKIFSKNLLKNIKRISV